MSTGNMQTFFERLGQGGEFRTRAEAAAGVPLNTLITMDLQQAEAPLGRLIDYAAKQNLPFTRDEVVSAFKKGVDQLRKKADSGELSDQDLATVAGGGAAGKLIGGVSGAVIGGLASFYLGPGAVAGIGAGATVGAIVGDTVQDLATAKWGNW